MPGAFSMTQRLRWSHLETRSDIKYDRIEKRKGSRRKLFGEN